MKRKNDMGLKHRTKLLCMSTIVALSLSAGCKNSADEIAAPPDSQDSPTITQGVWGTVFFWRGDFMPTVDTSGTASSRGTILPVSREIHVYGAARFDQTAHAEGGFYRTVSTKLVARIKSNRAGFFRVSLPPGKYSFFIKEGLMYYANIWDGSGHILPGVVVPDSLSNLRIDITYEATF